MEQADESLRAKAEAVKVYKVALIEKALEARGLAYAPYSRFHVGAALLLDDGTIIQGANVENASYGGAICAERTAIVKWQTDPAHRHKRVSGVAVASEAQAPCPPCGICRQVLREFCSMDTPILLPKSNWKPTDNTSSQPTTVVSSLSDPDLAVLLFEDLLPMSFGPTQLE